MTRNEFCSLCSEYKILIWKEKTLKSVEKSLKEIKENGTNYNSKIEDG